MRQYGIRIFVGAIRAKNSFDSVFLPYNRNENEILKKFGEISYIQWFIHKGFCFTKKNQNESLL